MHWLGKGLSGDSAVSNSRVLQTFIVINLITILWLVVGHAQWVLSDNTRLVMLTLITAGAGGYVANKLMEGKNAQ